METKGRISVAIINGTEEAIEKLKAEQGLTVDEEACLAVPNIEEIRPEEVMKFGYYRDNLNRLKNETAALTQERDELARTNAEQAALIKRQAERIAKLEQAFIEAALK